MIKELKADKLVIAKGIVLALLVSGEVIYAISLFITRGSVWNQILFVDANDSFMDFFNCLFHSSDRNPYVAADRIYPALCYLFYYLIVRFVPADIVLNGSFAIRDSQEGRTVYILYVVITTLVLAFVVSDLLKGVKHNRLIIVSLFLSMPFIYTFERGNLLLPTLTFMFMFLLWKDEENIWKRQLAFVSLAIAACFKLYPAVLGILLLREKRWKDILTCILYGIILFVFPFAFVGGFNKVFTMINALSSYASGTVGTAKGMGFRLNYANTYATLIGMLGGQVTEKVFAVGKIIARILSLTMLFSAFFQKNGWKVMAIVCSVMVGLPDFSYTYTMILMSVPLLFFLKKKTYEKGDIVYAVLFGMMFTHWGFLKWKIFDGLTGSYKLTTGVFFESLALVFISAILFVDTWISFFREKQIYDIYQ